MTTIEELRCIINEETHLTEDKMEMHAKNLRDLEDRNDHSGYAIYLAKMARDPKLLKAAKAVKIIHNSVGYMPQDLYQARRAISASAKAKLQAKMGKDFDRFWNMT